MRLPKTLDREPLVDAIFEVRMGGAPHLADLLPGALFSQLTPKPNVQRLPSAEIPQPIRDHDPNLAFSPLTRLDMDRFTISFGDRSLIISCKLPYPKWPAFKETILNIVDMVSQLDITGPVERYSIKYVNLIEAPTYSTQIAKINMSLRIGDVEATREHLSLTVHHNEAGTLHIMSVVSGAQAKMMHGHVVSGAVVGIDSIRLQSFADFRAFAENLEPAVESLRRLNKIKFFGCLTEDAIAEMGPTYD